MNIRKFLPSSIALLAVFTSVGCSRELTSSWSETVKQHDDKLLVVERKVVTVKSPLEDVKKNTGAILSQELKYEPLKLRWFKEGHHLLVSFAVFENVAWLAVADVSTEFCHNVTPQTPSYRFYKFENKLWSEVNFQNAPLDQMRLNLHSSPRERALGAQQGVLVGQRDKASLLSYGTYFMSEYIKVYGHYCASIQVRDSRITREEFQILIKELTAGSDEIERKVRLRRIPKPIE